MSEGEFESATALSSEPSSPPLPPPPLPFLLLFPEFELTCNYQSKILVIGKELKNWKERQNYVSAGNLAVKMTQMLVTSDVIITGSPSHPATVLARSWCARYPCIKCTKSGILKKTTKELKSTQYSNFDIRKFVF